MDHHCVKGSYCYVEVRSAVRMTCFWLLSNMSMRKEQATLIHQFVSQNRAACDESLAMKCNGATNKRPFVLNFDDFPNTGLVYKISGESVLYETAQTRGFGIFFHVS